MDPYVLGACSLIESVAGVDTDVAWIACRDRRKRVRHFVLIDESNREWAEAHRWHVKRDGYVYRNRSHITEAPGAIAMHREIALTADTKMHTDHANHDKWDNRAMNLRPCTPAQNRQNTGLKSDAKSSRLRGVSLYSQNGYTYWRARGIINGKEHSVGYFKTEQEANAAVLAFRREHMPFSTA